jgi:hypothetical protein
MNEFKNIVNKDRGSSKNIFPESINKINEIKIDLINLKENIKKELK